MCCALENYVISNVSEGFPDHTHLLFELHQRNLDKFWKNLCAVAPHQETSIDIAGTVMYINLISTCVTGGLTCVLRNDA